MGRFSKLTDRELDQLIAGKAPSGNHDLTELAGVLHDVKDGFQRPPSSETAARHLAAITQMASTLAGDAQASPATETPANSRSRGLLTMRNPLSNTRARLVVVIGAAALMLAAFGGVAHAGALPTPVQHTVSDVAGGLGISLPNGDDNPGDQGDQNAADQDTQGDDNDQGTAVVTEPGSVAQDDQGDDNSQGDQGGKAGHGSKSDKGGTTDQGGDNSQGDDNSHGDQGTSTGTADKGDQGDNSQGDQGSSGHSGGSQQGDDNNQGDDNSQGDQGGSSGGGSGSGSSQGDDNNSQ